MIEKERLIKAPTITAEEVADDDYILIDSPTLGVRKYLASKLLPEPYLYKWDFTKSLVDEKQGITAVLNGGATRDENGLHLQGAAQYCQFLFEDIVTTNKSYTLEMDCGDFVRRLSNAQYTLATYDENNGMYTFENAGGNGWGYWNGASWVFDKTWAEYNNSNIFDNKKISFIFGNSTITVKVDNTIVQNLSNTEINKIFRFIGNGFF